jgi:leucyl aminopeptidase
MKHVIIFCLIACFYGIYGQDDQMRLIRFNETYTKWMSMKEIDEMIMDRKAEGIHTGFVDVTEFPDFGVDFPEQGPLDIPSGPTHQTVVNPLLQQIEISNIWDTIQVLSAYHTRYYTTATGVNAVRELAQQYREIAGNRLGVDIHVFEWEHSWQQPSLVVEITGTNPNGERVVIGGHIDSTAGGASPRSPGADDDASGSATVLEVFRVLVESMPAFRPQRTLEFQAYAAEEVGLRGSQDIARYYRSNGYNVIGMLQLDMTGYVGRPNCPNCPTIGLVTDYTNAQLTSFVRGCIAEYCDLAVTLTQCGYGCSDHASWTSSNYPASFVFETPFSSSNPNIHTGNDAIGHLNRQHALEFAKIGVAFCVELSYREN